MLLDCKSLHKPEQVSCNFEIFINQIFNSWITNTCSAVLGSGRLGSKVSSGMRADSGLVERTC